MNLPTLTVVVLSKGLKMKMKILIGIGLIIGVLSGCKKEEAAQKIQAEVVAVYLIPGGWWETCLKYEDGSRDCWPNHKLGEQGEKLAIWRRGSKSWLQDPN